MQLLDAVFDVAALAVHPFVDPLRTLFHVGDDETGIVLRILSRRPDDFRFDYYTAKTAPFASRVVNFSIDVFGFSAAAGQLAGPTNAWGGDPFQHRIFGHRHHIFQVR